MVELTQERLAGLDTALNEARWLDLRVDAGEHRAVAIFDVLVLSTQAEGGHRRVKIEFSPVCRIAVSLRQSRRDDDSAVAEPVMLEDLSNIIRSFGGEPIYGEEFFDAGEAVYSDWAKQASLDLRLGDAERSHTVDLFQEMFDPYRQIDVRLWFDRLAVFDDDGQQVPLDLFIASGSEWWDRFWKGDPRTQGSGIYPIPEE